VQTIAYALPVVGFFIIAMCVVFGG